LVVKSNVESSVEEGLKTESQQGGLEKEGCFGKESMQREWFTVVSSQRPATKATVAEVGRKQPTQQNRRIGPRQGVPRSRVWKRDYLMERRVSATASHRVYTCHPVGLFIY
jgi:hypothetical protein